MLHPQLKKCLVASAFTLSTLGFAVALPHAANAQTGTPMQTGVDGDQANPGSEDGTGQVVPPPSTVEGSSETMTPGTMTPGTMTPGTMTPGQSESQMQIGVDGDQTNPGSTDGTGQVVPPTSTLEEDSEVTTPGTMTPGVTSEDSDSMEVESDSSITVPNSNMPSNTVPTTTTPSTTTPSTTTPSTITPSTITPSTTPTTTSSPSTSTSPRALW